MAETKKIILKEIDPVEIYGANNKILETVCSYFPELKVVARGDEIMLDGKAEDISGFEGAIRHLIEKRLVKRSLTAYDAEEYLDSPEGGGKPEILPADSVIVYGNDGKAIKARTPNQIKMVEAFYANDLIFALGPAGTGKTYVAIALAVRALKNREIRRIVLTRPAVEAGERLGFLPGDLKEKLDPYLLPLYDALKDIIPAKRLQEFIEDGTIEIAPLAYMRGRTLDRACVILDEAQNTSLGQLKMFLTRMGNDAKFIVTGDATQIDLPQKDSSGLLKGVGLVEKIKGVSIIRFDHRDIVRHPLVAKIVKAFEKYGATESSAFSESPASAGTSTSETASAEASETA